MGKRAVQETDYTDSHTTQIVVFRILDEEYGIQIDKVREIIELGKVTRMPKADYYIEGVINLRNHIIPIIDLHKRFKLGKRLTTPLTSVVIIDSYDSSKIGFIVDEVKEVVGLPLGKIDETPTLLSSNIDNAYLSGVGRINNRLIILLDIEKVLQFTNDTLEKS